MSEPCGFGQAWVGPCKNPKPCEKHAALECVSCGAPATRSCDETGQFVCGEPLCDHCEHAIFPDGTNGGIGFNAAALPEGLPRRHIRKDAQVFTPWYSKERR